MSPTGFDPLPQMIKIMGRAKINARALLLFWLQDTLD